MKHRVAHSNRNLDMLQIQQQMNHYNKIIQARPGVDSSCPSAMQPSRLRSKFYSEVERERLIENSKLVRKLTEIKNSKGLMHQDRYKSRQRGHSLQSEHQLLENEKQRLRENEIILRKLKSVRAGVGNHQQWDHHYEQFKTNERKLSRVNLELSGLEDRFYQTYADLTSKKPHSRKKLASENCKRSTTTNVTKRQLEHCRHCDNTRNVPQEYASDTMDKQNNEQTQNHLENSNSLELHQEAHATHRRRRKSHRKKLKKRGPKQENGSPQQKTEELIKMYES